MQHVGEAGGHPEAPRTTETPPLPLMANPHEVRNDQESPKIKALGDGRAWGWGGRSMEKWSHGPKESVILDGGLCALILFVINRKS